MEPTHNLTPNLSLTVSDSLPLLALLDKPLHLMSTEERREHVVKLRQMRTAPQTLLSTLAREGEASEVGKQPRRTPKLSNTQTKVRELDNKLGLEI